MSLTHAEQLSSPVLERTASRSASGWLTAFKLRRGRFASVSEAVHEPQRIAILLRPTALEWLGFCARSCAHELHEQLSPPHSESVTSSVPEKLRAKAGCAACICFCETLAAAFGAALSSCLDVARVQASFASER